jgi:hypothetical protein
MTGAPAIPARLADRPTVGGLVVPWISIESGDGRYVLGSVHTSRRNACVTDYRCQIDGELLDWPAVVFARPVDIHNGYTAEPAMHRECAAYSAKACPMVAGQMSHYRATPHDLSSLKCNEPGCGCAGWVNSADVKARAGKPADPYFALWLDRYDIAVDPDGAVIGVGWKTRPPCRIRPLGVHGDALALMGCPAGGA